MMIQPNSPKSPYIRKGRNYSCKKNKIQQSQNPGHKNNNKDFLRSSHRSEHFSRNLEPRSAIVCNYSTKQSAYRIIYQKASSQRRQIASLTKIMTLIITLQQIQKNDIIPQDQVYTVSDQAASIGGTSAHLQKGDLISLWDLLYGLMLPSGNDAAICIAENIGKNLIKIKKPCEIIQKTASNNFRINSSYKKWNSFHTKHNNKNQATIAFVSKMNQKARKLGMYDTIYTNAHGLSDDKAYSTVKDQMLLIDYCLKNQTFKTIVKTKLYFGSVDQCQYGWTRQMLWENTNKLLYHGYQGIKTGNTTQAKFCLASWYQQKQIDINMIIIVLGCQSKQIRDRQTLQLTKMAKKKIQQQESNTQNIFIKKRV